MSGMKWSMRAAFTQLLYRYALFLWHRANQLQVSPDEDH